MITSYICEEENGAYHDYKFDAEGMPLYQVITSGDGQTKQEQFFENGVRVKQILTSTDYIINYLCDENGNISEATTIYSEGTKIIEYYENGIRVGCTYYLLDGTATHYDANGNVISESNQ